jgi:hypothetical protein
MSALPGPAWGDLELVGGRVVVAGTTIEALPHDTLAQRAADAAAEALVLQRAA